MATAERREITEYRYILDLSADEAYTLRAVLARIGGSPHTSRRKDVHALEQALEYAGVISYTTDDMWGTMCFESEDE